MSDILYLIRIPVRRKPRTKQEIVMSYDPSTTAVLLVDPYNDFLSDGGKLWPRVKGIADEVGLLDHQIGRAHV